MLAESWQSTSKILSNSWQKPDRILARSLQNSAGNILAQNPNKILTTCLQNHSKMLEKSFQNPGRILRVCWQNPTQFLAKSWQFSVCFCVNSLRFICDFFMRLCILHELSSSFPGSICEVLCVLCVFCLYFLWVSCVLAFGSAIRLVWAHICAHMPMDVFFALSFIKNLERTTHEFAHFLLLLLLRNDHPMKKVQRFSNKT